jgi:hypothetical protein
VQGDVVACKTSPAFVDHLWEMLGPLLAGAGLLLLPDGLLPQRPAAFVAALASGRATHLVAVPSALQLLLPQLAAARQQLALRLVVSSGEPLSWRLARQLQDALPLGCTLLNIYGSTEVAADCTAFEVPFLREEEGLGTEDSTTGSRQAGQGAAGAEGAAQAARQGYVPAGRPIDGFQLAIIATAAAEGGGGSATQPKDSELNPNQPAAAAAGAGAPGSSANTSTPACSTPGPRVLPAGQAGEIWVAGAGLAAGYLDSPELTSRRFVQLQLDRASAQHLLLPPGAAPQLQARYFRTGDLGFIGPADGLLHVLGRRDHQARLLAPCSYGCHFTICTGSGVPYGASPTPARSCRSGRQHASAGTAVTRSANAGAGALGAEQTPAWPCCRSRWQAPGWICWRWRPSCSSTQLWCRQLWQPTAAVLAPAQAGRGSSQARVCSWQRLWCCSRLAQAVLGSSQAKDQQLRPQQAASCWRGG